MTLAIWSIDGVIIKESSDAKRKIYTKFCRYMWLESIGADANSI